MITAQRKESTYCHHVSLLKKHLTRLICWPNQNKDKKKRKKRPAKAHACYIGRKKTFVLAACLLISTRKEPRRKNRADSSTGQVGGGGGEGRSHIAVSHSLTMISSPAFVNRPPSPPLQTCQPIARDLTSTSIMISL